MLESLYTSEYDDSNTSLLDDLITSLLYTILDFRS